MSIKIARGHLWFRPMSVDLNIVLRDYDEAKSFVSLLDNAGYPKEADELQNAIDAEEQQTKATSELGYICDPEDRYRNLHLK